MWSDVSRISGPNEPEEGPAGINFYVGVDLGQSNDFTAIAIIEKLGSGVQSQFRIRRLERTRGTPYPAIVTRVKSVMFRLPGATLVIDGTGIGQPVCDMFEQANLRPISIFIHGGDKATCDESENVKARAKGWVTGQSRRWRVPKRDLVGVLQVLLQNQRLKIAPGPLSDVLAREMLNFRVKIDPQTSHDSYSAWREAEHDDLVLAVSLACWWGQFKPAPPIIPYPVLTYARG